MRGEVVLSSDELDADLHFFVDELGFELELITPADDPQVAVVVGHGLRLRLDAAPDRGADEATPGVGGDGRGDRRSIASRLRFTCDAATVERLGPERQAPGGTVIELVSDTDELTLPAADPRFELSRFEPSAFATGRASMTYRDLLPERQGGRFIASHIRIDDGGPVPDYVHHHRIRFQMIYCLRGWVRVVYEDQGPPFVLDAGDCVLQPPGIRHRVLECSPGLEVVEIGCPARHDTFADRSMKLPTTEVRPDRDFDGQRFVRHVAAEAAWLADGTGVSARDLGLADATAGLASARVVRPGDAGTGPELRAVGDHELLFVFLTAGSARLIEPDGQPVALGPSDALALPPTNRYRIAHWSPDFEALEVRLPARDAGTAPT